ncbi:MAG: hypothetical protein LBC75_13430 [Fibromonadaceae bacterium]|jgi:hypothetical protein|nr:hypothetical protein [Fibromonadaceae bacterium]
MKHTLLATILLLATANAATIAILEITLSSDEEMNLTVEETKFLTDELRRQATTLLPKEHNVLTREEIISRVPQTAENLSTAINIGRAIKSDYVTQGFIGKLGNLFTLTIEVYETSNGKLLSYFVKETPDLKGLLDAIRENSPTLFAKITQKEELTTIPTNIPTEPKKSKTSFWVAFSLDVLGAGALGLGIYNNAKSIDYYGKSKKLQEAIPKDKEEYAKNQNAFKTEYDKVQKAEKARNIFYATGGALLLGGIAVHIWF